MNVKETKKVAATSINNELPLKKKSTSLLNEVGVTRKKAKKATVINSTQEDEEKEENFSPLQDDDNTQDCEVSTEMESQNDCEDVDANDEENDDVWTEVENSEEETFDYEEVKKKLLSVYIQLEGDRLSETMMKVNSECDEYLDALYYFSDHAENVSEMEWLRFQSRLSRFITTKLKNTLDEIESYEKYVAQARELGLVEDDDACCD